MKRKQCQIHEKDKKVSTLIMAYKIEEKIKEEGKSKNKKKQKKKIKQ